MNLFETLNESLESENLLDLWDYRNNINYGKTARKTVIVNGRYRHIVICRTDKGLYERPLHYDAGSVAN